MQESHLKKVEKTDILNTLRSFNLGDSESIPYADSNVDTNTFRSRCAELIRNGHLKGKFRFIDINVENKQGTLIIRVA